MSYRLPRRLRVILVASVLGLVAAACGGETTTPASTSEALEAQADAQAEALGDAAEESAGDSVFAGEFVDLNGDSIDLASYEGQDVVLWFWAPW